MDTSDEKDEKKPKRHWLRRTILFLALLAVVWGFLVPNFLGVRFVRTQLMEALNDPELGLSCESVSVDFSYADLVLRRRVNELTATGIRLDASRYLDGAATDAFTNRTVTADFRLTPDPHGTRRGFRDGDPLLADLRGTALGHPFLLQARFAVALTNLATAAGTATVALAQRPRAAGEHLTEEELVAPSPWRATAAFTASPSEWQVEGELPEFALSEREPLVADVLTRLLENEMRRALTFSGRLGVKFSARKTREIPVTAWEVRAPVRDVRLDLAEKDKDPVAVRNFRTDFGADGIAGHTTIRPLLPRIDSVEAGGFALTNVFATLRMTERALLVTRAGAGFCGGNVSVYALMLNPESLSAGFTLFVDELDTGLLFPHFSGFNGTASGRLHGKIPLSIQNGSKLRFRDAFLYSTPGETGTLRMTDATTFVENLGGAALDEDSRTNFARVLENLDYQVLSVELLRDGADAMALKLKIDGSATRGKTTVPVNLAVTFHGDLERIVNTGLKAARK